MFKRACESEMDFQTVSGVCVGVYLSRALSFISFDVLLSVNHGRTDALPLIWNSMVKAKHKDLVLSCSSVSLTKQCCSNPFAMFWI